MYPYKHFFYAVLFAGFLFFLFPKINFLFIFIFVSSSVLIDIDHYLYYIYKKKNFNLKKSYDWFLKTGKLLLSFSREKRAKFYTGLFIFHGFEILILLFMISFFYPILFAIFFGFAFHNLLDCIDQLRYWDKIEKLSLIRDIFKHRKTSFIDGDRETNGC